MRNRSSSSFRNRHVGNVPHDRLPRLNRQAGSLSHGSPPKRSQPAPGQQHSRPDNDQEEPRDGPSSSSRAERFCQKSPLGCLRQQPVPMPKPDPARQSRSDSEDQRFLRHRGILSRVLEVVSSQLSVPVKSPLVPCPLALVPSEVTNSLHTHFPHRLLLMLPIVQISLDLTNIDEALETAHMAMRAGVDWLEAGTPLILAEGLHGIRALRKAFPGIPIVADLKTMDGGYLEAEMMAKAGATHVVVMERSHPETIKCVVKAGRDHGVKVMGDNMAAPCMIESAKRLEDLGCDFVIHHIGYDERRGIVAAGGRQPSPLDQLREVVQAVSIPVQAVGGLTLEQAIRTPEYGAPLVVLGAPLTIDADAFKTASGNLEESLRMICERVHAFGDVKVGR